MACFVCHPGERINGDIRVPGDKSISHRSIILSSIAAGRSHISGFLQGEDSLNTIRAFCQMGVDIERDGDRVRVDGVGLSGLRQPAGDLEMGNSGTAMRLLLGLLLLAKKLGDLLDVDGRGLLPRIATVTPIAFRRSSPLERDRSLDVGMAILRLLRAYLDGGTPCRSQNCARTF